MFKSLSFTISCFCLIIITNSYGQTYFDTTLNYQNYTETLNNGVYSDEGDYLVAPRSNSIDSFAGRVTLTVVGEEGNVINQYPFSNDSSAYTFGKLINLEHDSGYIFFGTEQKYYPTTGYINADYLVIRYNQDKSVRWTNKYGELNRYDFGLDGIQTYDGCFVIAGQSSDSLQTTADNLLVKLDSHGNQLWANYYGGVSFEAANSVIETPDSGFFIFGWTRSFGNGQRDWYLVKTDSLGNQQWQQTYGSSESESGSGITSMMDGNYLLSGGGGNGLARIRKIRPDGSQIWQRGCSYNGSESNFLNCAYELPDYSIIAVGGTNNVFESDAGYLVKLDSAGNLHWERKYNKSIAPDLFYNVLPTTDGGYLLTGQCLNPLTSNQDAWLLKVDSVGCEYENCTVGIEEFSNNGIVTAYPNPFSNSFNISYVLEQEATTVKVEVYDLLGRNITSQKLNRTLRGTLNVDLGECLGIYILRIVADEKEVHKEKIICLQR